MLADGRSAKIIRENVDRTVLDLLRHGEPVGGKRFRGHGVDDPLSDRGWEQMRKTTAALGGWQHVVSSPMQRCLAFADWIANEPQLDLTLAHDLREVGFGSWEGVDRETLANDRSTEYQAFYRDPVGQRPPGAEPLDAFGQRVSGALDRALEQFAGRHVLVVVHAGVIRAALGHVMRSPPICWYRANVDNAAVTRLASDRLGLQLVTHNWRP